MSHADEAEALHRSGLNCCQAIAMTFAEEYGLPRDQAMRVASGFGGGMGGLGMTCGAVTGAFMVIGLKHPRPDRASAGASSSLVRDFVRRFQATHGSINCRELLGCDISTPQGHQAARDAGLFEKTCPPAIRDAAELLDDLLAGK